VFSPADPHALYYASQYLFKTTDDAKTWTRISNDMTRPDAGVPAAMDEVAARDTDRNGTRGVIYTIAPSPLQTPLLWIGTDDGLIHVTTDDGKTWQNVTPAAITAWSRITMLEASHFDPAYAYASVDRHQLSDFDPHLYRTRDSGKTWQEITRGLPKGAYLHTIKEDPRRKGLLFTGSERGAFVSFDDGDSWQSLQLNLPVTSVRDFEVHGSDLIVATHGRGFWIIDDISVLRQLGAEVTAADAYLFKPSEAVMLIQGDDNGTPTQKDEPQVPTPPSGAIIDYYLKDASTGATTLEIADASGTTVASYSSAPPAAATPATPVFPPNVTPLWRPVPIPFSGAAGLHRVIWNPAGGGRGRGARPAATAGPGSYTVKLTVNGRTYTQPLMVKKDPRVIP